MKVKTLLLVALVMSLRFAEAYGQSTIDAREAERFRDIRLPETDAHNKRVKGFIEEIPDSDYFHASEKAYEEFNDFKFGVRIHWGIYSIWKMNGESWGFLALPREKMQEYQNLYKQFNPAKFNADDWMQLFDSSGIKCFAFTTKHHEGFSMFDTETKVEFRANYLKPDSAIVERAGISYSIMETPFKRDIVGELCKAAHKYGIKIDLYFSHPDWYDADFRPYNYHPLQTARSRDSAVYYFGNDDNFSRTNPPIVLPEPGQEERDRLLKRHREQLTELLTNYGKIDMLCLDQWMGRDIWPQMKETIKALRKLQPDVMLRARGIRNYGDYYTPEGFVPGNKENTKMPWMVIHSLGASFSYDSSGANYKGSNWIISNLIDAVSKGGNFMVGIGPDGTGVFHPAAVEQLLEAGKWLHTNGEAIYRTRARDIWKDGDHIRFTTTKDSSIVYLLTTKWPRKALRTKAVRPKEHSQLYLLGSKEPLKWTFKNGILSIALPEGLRNKLPESPIKAWAFKIVTAANQ